MFDSEHSGSHVAFLIPFRRTARWTHWPGLLVSWLCQLSFTLQKANVCQLLTRPWEHSHLIQLFFPLPYKFWLNFRVKTVYPALLKWISLQVVSTCQIFNLLICLFQLEFSVLCTYKYLLYCHHLIVDMWFLCNVKKKPFCVCCSITSTLKKQLASPETQNFTGLFFFYLSFWMHYQILIALIFIVVPIVMPSYRKVEIIGMLISMQIGSSF